MKVAVLFLLALQVSVSGAPVYLIKGPVSFGYHKRTCPMIGSATPTETTRGEATAKGVTACEVCLPDGPRKVAKLRIQKEKFADAYKAGKALDAATEVGVNKFRFAQLLQEFAAAYSILKDTPLTADEKTLADQFRTAIATYQVVGNAWYPNAKDLMSQMFLLCSVELTKATEMYLAAVQVQ